MATTWSKKRPATFECSNDLNSKSTWKKIKKQSEAIGKQTGQKFNDIDIEFDISVLTTEIEIHSSVNKSS